MNIGIIGAGSVARTVGQAWVNAGHSVMLSSRHPEKLGDAADQFRIGTPREAAEYGEVIFLAVNYESVESALAVIESSVDGKLVIDATNPLRYAEKGGTERVIEDDQIAGDLMQSRLPRARVGKAFTTLWTGYLEEHAFATPRIAMTLAVDTAEDRATIAALIEETGFEPVDLGTLIESRPLDPPSPVWNVVLTAPELSARVAAFRTTTRSGSSNNA